MEITKEENRREFFRHNFVAPLCAGMRIAKIGGKSLQTNRSYVCIKDIGAGGLRFETNLHLPVRNDVILSFRLNLSGRAIELFGTLVRCVKKDEESYEYGLKFYFTDEDKQQELFPLINKMSINLRKGAGYEGCSMCSLQTDCYKSLLQKKQEYHLTE